MPTLIQNISGSPISLPYPYYGLLGAGRGIIFSDEEAVTLANLGGADAIRDILSLTHVSDSGNNPLSIQHDPVIYQKQMTKIVDETYWVDQVLGSDDNVGTQLKPFKTINAALGKLPHVISANFTVNVKAGTYDERIAISTHFAVTTTLLTITGQDWNLVTPATGVNTGTFTSATTRFLTMTGAGWTVNNLTSKFVKMTSGTLAGKYYPIASNTATALEVATTASASSYNGQSFQIVMPAAIIAPSTGAQSVVTFRSQGTAIGSAGSSFVLNNLQFIGPNVSGSRPVLEASDNGCFVLNNCYVKTLLTNTGGCLSSRSAHVTHSLYNCIFELSGSGSCIELEGGSLGPSACFINSLNSGGMKGGPGIRANQVISLQTTGSIIQNFTDTTGGSGYEVSGCEAYFFSCVIRGCNWGISLKTRGIAAASGTEITGNLVHGVDIATPTQRGFCRFSASGASKIQTNGSDGIRMSICYAEVYLANTTDFGGNGGFGVNMKGAVTGDHGFNQVHVTGTVTATVANTLGDMAIDGVTATSLATLRAAPGKTITDTALMHRMTSD